MNDRFELTGVAGSGGMGEVFRARDRENGALVALKVLRDTGGDRERFARALVDLVARMLEKEPEDRPADGADACRSASGAHRPSFRIVVPVALR